MVNRAHQIGNLVKFDVNLVVVSSDFGCESSFFGGGFLLLGVEWTDNDFIDEKLHQLFLVFQRKSIHETLEVLQATLYDV